MEVSAVVSGIVVSDIIVVSVAVMDGVSAASDASSPP
jgi:hypothetical protein